jgi:hypothetical protein
MEATFNYDKVKKGNTSALCEVSGFQSSVFEYPSLLGRYAI